MKALHTSWSSRLALPRSKPKPVESCHEVSSKKRTNLRPPRPPNFEALPRPTQATSDQDVTSKRLLLSQATGPNQALPQATLVVAKMSLQSSGNTLYCRHHYRHFLAVPSPTTGAPPIATFCCRPLIWAVIGARHRRWSYKAIDVALSFGGYVVLPCMWLRPPARSNPATCTLSPICLSSQPGTWRTARSLPLGAHNSGLDRAYAIRFNPFCSASDFSTFPFSDFS